MTLEECYAAMDGDYEGVLHRFRKQEMVRRFLTKLPADPNYEELVTAMEAKDYPTAFRASHSLKGIGLNLGLTVLAEVSSHLSDKLRTGTPEDGYEELYEQVQKEYKRAIDAIASLDA